MLVGLRGSPTHAQATLDLEPTWGLPYAVHHVGHASLGMAHVDSSSSS